MCNVQKEEEKSDFIFNVIVQPFSEALGMVVDRIVLSGWFLAVGFSRASSSPILGFCGVSVLRGFLLLNTIGELLCTYVTNARLRSRRPNLIDLRLDGEEDARGIGRVAQSVTMLFGVHGSYRTYRVESGVPIPSPQYCGLPILHLHSTSCRIWENVTSFTCPE